MDRGEKQRGGADIGAPAFVAASRCYFRIAVVVSATTESADSVS